MSLFNSPYNLDMTPGKTMPVGALTISWFPTGWQRKSPLRLYTAMFLAPTTAL